MIFLLICHNYRLFSLVVFLIYLYQMKLKEQNPFHFSALTIAFPLYFVLFLWFVYWFEMEFGYNFVQYSLYPRTWKGLTGIFVSPFIHGNVKHLFSNSVPLFVLLFTLLYFYRKVAFKVLIYGTILLGFLTWIIGRPSYHIGASGIIYLLFSFIFFSGLFQKYYRLIAVSLMVIFLYGGMIWYIFPTKEEISWEGHLSGLIVGLLFAVFYRNSRIKTPQYDWEKEDYTPDKFDLQFDENGNFVPPEPEEVLNDEVNDSIIETQKKEERLKSSTTNTTKKHDFIINYVIKNEEE